MNKENVYVLLQKHLEKELPFVIYRKPSTDILQVFLQQDDQLYEVKDYSDSGFIFAPFDHDKKAVIIPRDKSVFHSILISNLDQEYNKEVKKSTNGTSDIAKKHHIKLIREGINAVNSGNFEKVVLSRREEVSGIETSNKLTLFQRLVRMYKDAFVYCWYHPKVGTWLGATPETLLSSAKNTYNTMALAGTQPFYGTEDVDWGVKEVVEQKMVTEFIVKQLSSVSSEVESSKPYTHRAGSLLHIRTDLMATLDTKKFGLGDVIGMLHPTPAVCGLPKMNAKIFIDTNEGYDREFYTGFLGELNMQLSNETVSNFFVNLRCMQLVSNNAILYVGGGITKDSDPDKEWEETVRKTETMKRILF
ncbi:isochorismate synthase [Aquimarina pacifica]|uniref:isochorismate synthase n=1 Tax=Aquimarina pacifica TaxID=1296415 RepID=UPI000472EEC8|nr:isochorismate synthase [Aquimarina pacifica]